jgi:hypothetical protein
MTKLSSADVEFTRPSLPERKRFQNILESGVFSPDVIDNIQAKILPVVRTLKSKITEKTTLNRTVAPLIKEIMDEMGKQADIDIKKAMGGKENQELQNWLITNKKTILENLTTTWLMGKDNGKVVLGGMPFAIQKKVAGRWLNYPDWIGKKVDRESVDVDLAGRTAGHEMVRRLPEVNKNVSTMEFLSSIIDLETGNVLRGRKEALAKVLAEEISFDIISDDIANDGIIAEALNRNQELKGAITEKIIVEEFNRLAERGNVKFSITKSELNALFQEMKNDKDFYIKTRSIFNQTINRIIDANDKELDSLYNILIAAGKTFNKFHWRAQEKLIATFVKKAVGTNFNVEVEGGNNQYVPDIIITPNSKLKDIEKSREKLSKKQLAEFNAKIRAELSTISVILEAKKAANMKIPLTSTTANFDVLL